MIADSPAALRYILQDDLYLLNQDKAFYASPDSEPEPIIQVEPEIVKPAPPVPQAQVKATIATPVINVPEGKATEIKTAGPTYKYLGENKKQFLILVHYKDATYMAEPHLKALESTLTRKLLTMADVAILNTASYTGADLASIKTFFKPLRVLILGAGAMPAGLTGTVLNSIITQDGMRVLFSYSFVEMMGNKDKTRSFWEQMKNL